MLRFLFRRLLASIPVLFGIVVLTFVLTRVLPGNPCVAELGEKASAQQCAQFNHREGLDRPVPVQLGKYIVKLGHGDLGISFRQRRPVTALLAERLPVTLELSLAALLIAIAIGIPLGILAAYRHNSLVDAGAVVAANVGVSMPVFWLGLMFQYLFAVTLKKTPLGLPPSGRLDPGIIAEPFYKQWGWHSNGVLQFLSRLLILDGILTWKWSIVGNALRHLVLPALTLSTIPLAIIARMTRSSLLDTLGLDYVRTARAKGLGEFLVVVRHALRNALLPVSTIIGLQLGSLLGGAILTETIFNITGVGQTLYDAISSRDYSVVSGFTLVVAIVFVVLNLLTDLLYTVLDPKVRIA
jgi:peptide/nickel transport system permease protein